LDAPILETEKTLKTLSSGQIYLKNHKKTKNLLCWFFLKKPGFFPTLAAGPEPGLGLEDGGQPDGGRAVLDAG
jgi:hypothetical protein